MAAWHAARMMVPAKQGLIINVSSIGGLTYLFNVAYGIGKAAVRATYYRLQNEIEVCVTKCRWLNIKTLASPLSSRTVTKKFMLFLYN